MSHTVNTTKNATINPNLKLYSLLILTLTGFVISFFLSKHFYEIRSGFAFFKSFCNINSQWNCDAVALSRYAETFFGVPLSNIIAGWFLSFFVIILFAFNRDWFYEAVKAAFIFSGVGVIFSIFYLVIMVFILKTFCVLCVIIEGINILSLMLVFLLKPSLKSPDFAKWKTFGISTLIIMSLSLLFLNNLKPESLPSSVVNDTIDSILGATQISVGDGKNPLIFGSSEAPITIVEFSDFQCPHCKHGAILMNTLLTRFHNKLRVVFRNFPLDPSCNRSMQGGGGHTVACEAAKIVICAKAQGKFREVYELFFDNQTKLEFVGPLKLVKLAKNLEIDEQKLLQCINAEETQKQLSWDIEEGMRLGIQSTPTFFINGRKVEGALPMVIWEKVIEQL
ncbi:MAG: thioredoxin domain-containing protein [Deltaproteobacteria bacterium]|nr:thioredoxin domain-containing protein [Deltaproteobacteria bacterium]